MDDVFKMQEQLSKENGDLKKKREECEMEIGVTKKENKALRTKCKDYEDPIHDMRVKLDECAGQSEGVMEVKFEELKNVWKQEKEEEQISFKKVMEKQIQEKTKDTMVQVIKEKEGLVCDTVEKKSLIIYGLKEKKKSSEDYQRKGREGNGERNRNNSSG